MGISLSGRQRIYEHFKNPTPKRHGSPFVSSLFPFSSRVTGQKWPKQPQEVSTFFRCYAQKSAFTTISAINLAVFLTFQYICFPALDARHNCLSTTQVWILPHANPHRSHFRQLGSRWAVVSTSKVIWCGLGYRKCGFIADPKYSTGSCSTPGAKRQIAENHVVLLLLLLIIQ